MADLNKLVDSAATLIRQATETEDEEAKAKLQEAARTLLETVYQQMGPADPDPAPAADPDPDEEDD